MAAGSSKDLETIQQEFQNNASNIESARFLKRVIQKAEEEEGTTSKHLPHPIGRAFIFTGLDKRVFPLLSTDVKVTDVKKIERSLIHSHLTAFYLNPNASDLMDTNMIPTTKNLFKSLYRKIPFYVDIRTFRKYLAQMGYIWLRTSQGYIVMERPSVTFERYYYLKDIIKYRGEDRQIFYVDETVMTADRTYYNLKKYNSLMKTAKKAGINIIQDGSIKSIFAVSKSGVHALKHFDDFTLSNFEDWIINELIPIMPEKSVVVIRTTEHQENMLKKPTLYSIKTDMIEWLELNNVPYDENMSKCDLIDLIDTYTTESAAINKLETVIKLKGHELLRLPTSIEEMTPAEHFFELIKLNAPNLSTEPGDIMSGLFESVDPMTLQEYDEYVAESERETLQTDVKMDEILDGVIKDISNLPYTYQDESEVPLSDSD